MRCSVCQRLGGGGMNGWWWISASASPSCFTRTNACSNVYYSWQYINILYVHTYICTTRTYLWVIEHEGGAVRGKDAEVLPGLFFEGKKKSGRESVCMVWVFMRVDFLNVYLYIYISIYNTHLHIHYSPLSFTCGKSPCVMNAKSACPRCASAAACSARSCVWMYVKVEYREITTEGITMATTTRELHTHIYTS